jgi:DNA-binding transcriptional MocR family regulator
MPIAKTAMATNGRRGALSPGDPLPTVRELAVALGINANTVTRVYRDLQQEGPLGLGDVPDHYGEPTCCPGQHGEPTMQPRLLTSN